MFIVGILLPIAATKPLLIVLLIVKVLFLSVLIVSRIAPHISPIILWFFVSPLYRTASVNLSNTFLAHDFCSNIRLVYVSMHVDLLFRDASLWITTDVFALLAFLFLAVLLDHCASCVISESFAFF